MVLYKTQILRDENGVDGRGITLRNLILMAVKRMVELVLPPLIPTEY